MSRHLFLKGVLRYTTSDRGRELKQWVLLYFHFTESRGILWVGAAIPTGPFTGDFSKRDGFFRGLKAKIKVPDHLVPGGGLVLFLALRSPSCCIFTYQTEENLHSSAPASKDTNPICEGSMIWLPLKTLPPNIKPWGLGLQHTHGSRDYANIPSLAQGKIKISFDWGKATSKRKMFWAEMVSLSHTKGKGRETGPRPLSCTDLLL